MLVVIEHRDYTRSVRDDLFEEQLACVSCKGVGSRWHMTGGGLWSTEWTSFRCQSCNGIGMWRRPALG